MLTLVYPALAAIVKVLCICSSLYILFSPLAMWIYIGLCLLSGIENTWAKNHKKNKIYA